MWPQNSILFSACYCGRTNGLAWLGESPQGRVDSCKIYRLIKQVIGHVLKPWKDNAEYPLPLFDFLALYKQRVSSGRVTNAG